jgi:hypothetical protein
MWAMDVKTKFTISVDHLIARIDFFMAPTVSDLLAAVQSILTSTLYNSGLRLLIVDHGTDFNLHESQLQELIKRQAPQFKAFKSCAIAVLKEHQFGIARTASSHFLHDGISFGVFKDEVAAGVWLLGTA